MESLLNILFPTTLIGQIIIPLIICLTVVDIYTYLKDNGKNHRSFKNDVVTIGILGTFIGIFWGLYEFNTHNITESIPPLLEGMKLAFKTSIAGMVCSVLLNLLQKFWSSPYAKSGNPVTDGLADQSRLLAEFLKESKTTNEAVVEQVKNHRIEAKDELTKVRDSLDRTLEKLSEGASKEIIKALEQVITDFNQNLTEQFGENFKQLNDACLQLVEWQKSYMEVIKASESALSATKDSLQSTAQSVSEIAERNEQFEEFCKRTALSLHTMNTMLKNNKEIQETIKQSIDSLKSLSGDLKEIPDDFKTISTKMNENNARATEYLRETTGKLDEYITQSQEAVKKLNTDMAQATNNLNRSLTSLTDQFGKSYQSFIEQIEKLMPGTQR